MGRDIKGTFRALIVGILANGLGLMRFSYVQNIVGFIDLACCLMNNS